MSTPPASLRQLRKPINLSTLATILGLIFSLAFGTCCVSGISLSKGGNIRSAETLIATALIMGAASAAGLAVIVILTIMRAKRNRTQQPLR
jgi:hypothetical protein